MEELVPHKFGDKEMLIIETKSGVNSGEAGEA